MNTAAQKAIAKKAADTAMARRAVDDPMLDPSATAQDVIRHALARMDEVAVSMERKWGAGKLPSLVSEILTAKFEAQQRKLTEAIEAGADSALIAQRAAATVRGWEALDKAATEAGHKPMAPVVFKGLLPSTGEEVWIAPDEASAHHAAQDGRMVFTLAEIMTVIDALAPVALETKRQFAATIATVRAKGPMDWERGDQIPF